MNASLALVEGLDSDRTALVLGGRATSARALRDRAMGLAAWLRRRGVQPGDRAVLVVPPGPDFTAALVALVWVGAVPVLLDAGQPPAVRRTRLALAAPAWTVSSPGLAAAWRLGLPGLIPALPERSPGALLVLPRRARGGCEHAARGPGDEALIVFTSGTSGQPRGVVHCHGNLGHYLEHVRQAAEGLELETYLAETPQQIFYALLMGATCYLVRGRGDRRLARTLRCLRDQPVRAWFGSPWTWQAWMDRGLPPPAGLRSLILGSAPVSRPFLRRLLDFLPREVQVRCLYGLTEVGPACLIDGREKAASRAAGDPVGQPLPALRLRVASGEPGEVQIASPSLAAGYLGEPPLGTWLDTGDLGRLTEGGLELLGRRKDMIIRRGVNLYPALYEPLLQDEVEELALVGVYDRAAEDERVVLAYAGPPGLSGAALAEAAPDHVLRLEHLPRAGRQNKVDKARLRELAREAFSIP